MTAEQLVGSGYNSHLDTRATWTAYRAKHTCEHMYHLQGDAAFRLCFDPGEGPVGVVRCSLFTVADTEAPPADAAGLNHVLRYACLLLSPVWIYQTTSPLFHVSLRCLTTHLKGRLKPFHCSDTCLNEKCACHTVNTSIQAALPLFSSPSLFVFFYSSARLHSPSLGFGCSGQLLRANDVWKPSDVICSWTKCQTPTVLWKYRSELYYVC